MTLLDRIVHSRVNYWLGFVLDVAVSVAAIVSGVVALGPVASLAWAASGVVLYSAFEYVLHRWLYHWLPNPFRTYHAYHHRNPNRVLGAPPIYTLSIFGATWSVSAVVASVAAGAVIAGVLLLLYAYQSVLHHVAHAWPGSGTRWAGAAFRRRHLAHHRDGRANFGIVFTIWDRLLGTYRASRR